MLPQTHYAKNGSVSVAYQVLGEGPLDLVYIPGWVSNIEIFWEDPAYARFLKRLASFSRLIVFDQQGTGLSDRVSEIPGLEVRMNDVGAVLEAVGSTRTALLGSSEGGVMAALFAATYPERVSALVMHGAYARLLSAPESAADDRSNGVHRGCARCSSISPAQATERRFSGRTATVDKSGCSRPGPAIRWRRIKPGLEA